MNKEKVALVGYIAFIFVLMAVAMLFDVDEAAVYIQAALVAMGVAAVVLQKVVHRGRLLDMGFRPGRKAAIGMGVGLVFTAIMLALAYWLPQQLGFIDLTVNPDSPLVGEAVPLLATLVSLAISGGLMFVMALLTEELVHRGYILPKLEQFLGGPKAVVASAVLFGLWHIPAYYSVYAGGAEQQGLVSVLASAMLGSGLSVVPLCLLYLTTRELYGVSLSHALANLFAYSVVASPELGVMAQQAIYNVRVLNQPAYEATAWILPLVGIPIMLGLTALARRLIAAPSPPEAPAG